MRGWFFLIVGAVLLVGAVAATVNVRRFLARAETVPGQVVRLNAGGSHPQIAFVTRTGERVSYPQGGWIAGYRAGDAVSVSYDPSVPKQSATIDAIGALWAWPIALAVLGFGFLVGGGVELIAAGRR